MKSLIKSNIYLYTIWTIFIKRSYSRLPNRKNIFFFTGYPRSGNSFFTNLLKYSVHDLNFSHHLHTIASIKIALNKNIPVIVIVRNPLDSISSWYVMKNNSSQLNSKLTTNLLNKYVDYYNFLNRQQTELNFISFEKVVLKPKTFVEALINFLPNYNFTNTIKSKMDDFIEEDLITKKQSKMSSTHSIKFSSTPNHERNILKQETKELIKQQDNFSIAQKLYMNLIK